MKGAPAGKAKPKSAFQQAVEATPDVCGGFRPGLQALGNYSDKVRATDNGLLSGSVDIDKTTKAVYINENRWDFTVGYDNYACFVEIHPASTSEVDVVLKKLEWLKKWLQHKAPRIREMKPKHINAYYWVFTKGNGILKTSPQYRQLAACGLKITRLLTLDNDGCVESKNRRGKENSGR